MGFVNSAHLLNAAAAFGYQETIRYAHLSPVNGAAKALEGKRSRFGRVVTSDNLENWSG